MRLAFELAEQLGLGVDLHCDETDDPGSRNLEVVCAQALDRGFQGRVVAGHCTALHSYPNPYAAKVIELGCPPEKAIVHHIGVDLSKIRFRARRVTGSEVRFLVAGVPQHQG